MKSTELIFCFLAFIFGMIVAVVVDIGSADYNYPTTTYISVSDKTLNLITMIQLPNGDVRVLRKDAINMQRPWVDGTEFRFRQKFIGNKTEDECDHPQQEHNTK